MASYIKLSDFKEDDRVTAISKTNKVVTGRVFRVTPTKDNYALISVLSDDKEDILVVQYDNKITKL
jgi:hypothetical protein